MPEKRKVATSPPPAKRKEGSHLPGLPFTKQAFLTKAKDIELTLELTPKQMHSGSYGWQQSEGLMKVDTNADLGGKVVYIRPSCIANVFGSNPHRNPDQGGMKTKDFLEKAKPLTVTFDCWPCEFSTGSFGWRAYRGQKVKVGDKELAMEINMNCPIHKSYEAHVQEVDTAFVDIPETSLPKPTMDIIGTARKKDDLTKIRGIGPWIEKRLNKISITTFKQIAKMTPEIQHEVNVAIKYFPGRVKRDQWVYQAQIMVKGDWDKLNPSFPRSGKGNYIKIDGVEYERRLIDLANYEMKDGIIEFWGAEALWWSATDDERVTPTEKRTLEYILKTKKLSGEAETHLKQRIAKV